MATAERWEGHPPLPDGWEERLADIVTRLQQAGADLIYVFGSSVPSAPGAERAPGDLDLAVWGLKEDIWRVRADVEGILGTDRFDLVRLEDAEPELRFGVIAHGRCLYSRDTHLENEFELGALREYRDLVPFRRIQREHMRARHGVRGS